jgi:hypothetical protein
MTTACWDIIHASDVASHSAAHREADEDEILQLQLGQGDANFRERVVGLYPVVGWLIFQPRRS